MSIANHKLLSAPLLAFGGALATFGLFYLMQHLIVTDFLLPTTGTVIEIKSPVMPEFVYDVNERSYLPEKDIEIIALPVIEIDRNIHTQKGDNTLIFTTPQLSTDIDDNQLIGVPDTNAIVLVQVSPTYPTRALARGIEGYVIVEFEVSAEGIVENPRVLFAEPQGYFESAALKALERYRYQPKVINGQTVKMYEVQQKFSFNLDQ